MLGHALKALWYIKASPNITFLQRHFQKRTKSKSEKIQNGCNRSCRSSGGLMQRSKLKSRWSLPTAFSLLNVYNRAKIDKEEAGDGRFEQNSFRIFSDFLWRDSRLFEGDVESFKSGNPNNNKLLNELIIIEPVRSGRTYFRTGMILTKTDSSLK